jgi:hypothetical protein
VAEIAALGMRPESHQKMMRDNALEVFTRIPRPKAARKAKSQRKS